MRRRFQALLLLSLLVCLPSAAADEIATSRLLQSECESLISSAVKRPFGWGWGDPQAQTQTDAASSRAPVINLDPSFTPAAGLLLHYVGAELKNDQLKDAARNVARALVASQEPRGRIPSRIVFSNMPRTRDAISSIPDRAPTAAALMLLLTVVRDQPEDESLQRGAARAALWLSQQQTHNGSWPSSLMPKPGASAIRIIRLDTPDYRDCTLAMIFASQSLSDARFKFAATRAAEQLLRLRIQKSRTASGLWHPAYDLSGLPSEKAFPGGPAVDALATQHAMQTLLAANIAFGGSASSSAIQEAAARLEAIRIHDKWRRVYPLSLNEIAAEALVAPPPDPLTPPDKDALSAFGIPRLLLAAAALKTHGRERYQPSLTTSFPHSGTIPLTICGLHDQPFDPLWPSTPSAAEAFLSQNPDLGRFTQDGAPPRLDDRLRRIHSLLLRLKLEQHVGKVGNTDRAE